MGHFNIGAFGTGSHYIVHKVCQAENRYCIDENLQHGQIRRLQEDLVASNMRGMLDNPPAVLLRLLVWQDPGNLVVNDLIFLGSSVC